MHRDKIRSPLAVVSIGIITVATTIVLGGHIVHFQSPNYEILITI
jgi:hypothetical protein